MTGNRPYNNPASQAERRATLRNDRRVQGFTFHDMAIAEAGTVRGRYGAISKTQVVGSAPAVQYPKQPASSPWASDPAGLEPPLGVAIDEMPPTGEFFEIEKSMREVHDGADSTPPDPLDALPGAARSAAGSHQPVTSSAPAPPKPAPDTFSRRDLHDLINGPIPKNFRRKR